MITKVKKWGNSQALRLTKRVLEDAHIAVGDPVDVAVKDGMITLKQDGIEKIFSARHAAGAEGLHTIGLIDWLISFR